MDIINVGGIGGVGGVGYRGDLGETRRGEQTGGESFKAHLAQSSKDMEINAVNVARVPGETKRMAVVFLDSGKATSADEAIIMAQEKAGAGEGASGLSLLRGLGR